MNLAPSVSLYGIIPKRTIGIIMKDFERLHHAQNNSYQHRFDHFCVQEQNYLLIFLIFWYL